MTLRIQLSRRLWTPSSTVSPYFKMPFVRTGSLTFNLLPLALSHAFVLYFRQPILLTEKHLFFSDRLHFCKKGVNC